MPRLLPLLLTVALIGLAGPAFAQGATPPNYNVTWSLLSPGNDWAAQVVNDVFPVFGPAPTGGAQPSSTGTEATVIGTMLGTLTAFVSAIAMLWVAYIAIINVHRGAETARLLGSNQTSMWVVRLGVAAVMMFPIPSSGFSVGQAIVVKSALWGVGMARVIYNNAVKAIGPDGKVIAQPMIPGTKTIVVGMIENELCRSLINAASNNPNLVPEPVAITLPALTGSPGYLTYAYNLASGESLGSPVCGAMTLQLGPTGQTNFLGVSVDETQLQEDAYDHVLSYDVEGPVNQVAQALFDTHSSAALAPLQGVLENAVADYQQRLTDAASQYRSALQGKLTQAGNSSSLLDMFTPSTIPNQNQLSTLGWTAAGAYYLEFARLNGQTLSLLTATPNESTPSYAGLGHELSADVAPLVQSASAFLDNLSSYASTNDGLDAPGGNADLFTGATPGSDGSTILDRVARSMHLTDYFLQLVTSMIEPASSYWYDPFGNLMALGNTMVTTALLVLGAAAALSSKVAAGGAALMSALSGNIFLAAGTLVAHNLVSFLAVPITMGCLALLIPGLTIAYVIPAIPFIMWIAGVIGWLIMVCEGVIAAPLWMLAHMTTQGDGLHGRAHHGYGLLFNIMFRPVLMLFGLFLGYFIFSCSCWLIRQTFGIMAGAVLNSNGLVSNLVGVIVLLAIFVWLHVTAALYSFRMIALVPHHVPRMLGFAGEGRVDMDQFSRDVGIVGMAAVMKTMSDGLLENVKGRLTPPGKLLSGPKEHLGGRGPDSTTKQITGGSMGGEDRT